MLTHPTLEKLQALNPELRAGRTPPAMGRSAGVFEEAEYTILVPVGHAAAVRSGASKLSAKGGALERYVVRFGETLDQIASARKTTRARLAELNGIGKDEAIRAGTPLLVPVLPSGSAPPTSSPWARGAASEAPVTDARAVVVVPGVSFAYPDRQRLFYRVVTGDTPREIAQAFGVTVDELATWNSIAPSGRLQEGMMLQVFAPRNVDLSGVVALRERDARVVALGSDAFFGLLEAQKGRKRVTIQARGGETLEQVGRGYGVTGGSMERINRRKRSDVLRPGEAVIVYTRVPAPASSLRGAKDAASGEGANGSTAREKEVARAGALGR